MKRATEPMWLSAEGAEGFFPQQDLEGGTEGGLRQPRDPRPQKAWGGLLKAWEKKPLRDLLFTAHHLEAEEAYRMGLVSEVVEDTALLPRVRELSWQLCANSAQSIRANKALLARIVAPDLDEALDYACELNARSRSSAD